MASEHGAQKEQALASLREVAAIAEVTGATSVARPLREDRIARLERDQFHLVVLGEFNHGKTSFVNALLGAPLLPMGVTPTTAIVHSVAYGDEPDLTAVTGSGQRNTVPHERLHAYVVGAEGAGEGVERLELRAPVPLLKSGLVLIDTPGVNDLNLTRADITYGAIPRSDAVLFLLDAGQVLKESERSFLAGKLLATARHKVFFIINKVDLLSASELEEALAYTRLHLGRLVDEPRVYPVSAQKALAGQGDHGLDGFLRDLETYLQEERGRVVIDNALAEGLHAAATLRTGIEIQRHALSLDRSELERRIAMLEKDLANVQEGIAGREARVREAIASVKARVRADAEKFGAQFAQALPAEIEVSTAKDLERYLATFIEERFLQFTENEAEEVTRRLERVAHEAIAFMVEDAASQSKRLEDLLGPTAPRLELKASTFAYDVSVFALGAFGITLMAFSNVMVGGAMALAAPVLAYVLKGHADRQVRERAMREAPEVVKAAATRIADAFEKEIDAFADRLVELIARMSQEMARTIAELVRVSRTAVLEGEDARARLETAAGMALVRLAAVDQRMRSLRSALWTNGKNPQHT